VMGLLGGGGKVFCDFGDWSRAPCRPFKENKMLHATDRAYMKGLEEKKVVQRTISECCNKIDLILDRLSEKDYCPYDDLEAIQEQLLVHVD
jgi:hypothetical protein